jgi:hypothetical protein
VSDATSPIEPAGRAGPGHQATSRDELRHRWGLLVAAARAADASGGPLRALQALGAFALLWYSPAMCWREGTIPFSPVDVARRLGVDARRWRVLADLLAEAGFLVADGDGYRVPDPAMLRGVGPAYAPATAGFLWTSQAGHGRVVAALRGQVSGRRGPLLLLGLIGVYELVRVLRAHWMTGKAMATGEQLRADAGLSRRAWTGYAAALAAANVLTSPRRGRWQVQQWAATMGLHRRGDAAEPAAPTKRARFRRTKNAHSTRVQGGLPEGETPTVPAPEPDHAVPAKRRRKRRGRDQPQPSHPGTAGVLAAVAAAYDGGWRVAHRPAVVGQISQVLESLAPAGASAPDHQRRVARRLATELTTRSMTGVDSIPAVIGHRLGEAAEAVRRRDHAEHAAARARENQAAERETQRATTPGRLSAGARADLTALLARVRLGRPAHPPPAWARGQGQS